MSTSVADPGCLSRIPDPDFYPFRILDPGSPIPDLESWIPDPGHVTNNSIQRGRGKIFVLPFFVATNITKLKIIIFLNWVLLNRGLGAGIRYHGSGKILFQILDTGVKKGTGSRIRINKALE
jgi:hypothetical protein